MTGSCENAGGGREAAPGSPEFSRLRETVERRLAAPAERTVVAGEAWDLLLAARAHGLPAWPPVRALLREVLDCGDPVSRWDNRIRPRLVGIAARYTSAASAEDAVRRLERLEARASDPNALAMLRRERARILAEDLGEVDRAESLLARAKSELANPRSATTHLLVMQQIEIARHYRGDLERTRALTDELFALRNRFGTGGEPNQVANALEERARVRLDAFAGGDPGGPALLARAREDLRRALDLREGLNNARGLTWCYGLIALVEAHSGNDRAGLSWLDRAIDLAARLGDEEGGIRPRVNRAQIRLATGDVVGAEEDAERALVLAERWRDPVLRCRAHLARANARRARGEEDGARADFAAALRLANSFSMRAFREEIRSNLRAARTAAPGEAPLFLRP